MYSSIKNMCSTIITNEMRQLLLDVTKFKPEDKFRLLYRASRDGFGAKDFHSRCDDKANTLTIIKTTKQFVFGGYANATWNQVDVACKHKEARKAFIFSLANSEGKAIRMEKTQNYYHDGDKSLYCSNSYGPSFGLSEFKISDHSNANEDSTSKLQGQSFEFSSLYYMHKETTFLAGSEYFKVAEIEVYHKI